MGKLLINNRSLSQSKQTKNSMEKPSYYHQTQHHVTHQPHNIRRQTSCGAIHQKYAPSPNVQLEMVQAAVAGGGVFLNHYPLRQFSLNSSLPPILPTHLQPYYYHQQKKMNHQQQQQQQQHPPLLPLPLLSKPAFRSLPPSPFSRKKPSKIKPTTTAATTTTTSRKPAQNIKKENKVVVMVEETGKDMKTGMNEDDEVVGPVKEKEPDPVSAPKESTTRVLREADLNNNNTTNNNSSSEVTEVPSFFSLMSPPPSSLPLPKFKMRQKKLSCNAEAAADGVDSGATENLRRMLKLR